MSATPSLSIVIAVQDAEANLPEIREALHMDSHPGVEFLFVHTARPGCLPTQHGSATNARDLVADADVLIPVLWRDGIRAASGTWIATTTAHCIPAPDWVTQLEASTGDPAAAIGGVFVNHAAARAMDWAIFLLRYSMFAAPQARRTRDHVAADNALYRRALVVQENELLDDGFWEPSFHARFRAQGYLLRIEPELCVVHRNRYSALQFFRQRVAHGRRFGRERSAALPWPKRAALLLAAPLLPLIFLRKIVRNARAHPVCAPHLTQASGWLLVFLLAWGWGEGLGYLDALVGKGSS